MKAYGVYTAINDFVDPSKTHSENISSFRMAIQKAEQDDDSVKFVKEWSNVKFSLLKEDEKKTFMNFMDADLAVLLLDSITARSGRIRPFSDVWNMMHDEEYAKVPKKSRKVIYGYARTERPVGDNAFGGWNGLQIIDLDIKDVTIASVVKDMLFDILCEYHWFVGVTLSSSGNGVHVYTKIYPMSTNLTARKTEYFYNFQEKYAAVYSALECISFRLLNENNYISYNIIDNKKLAFSEMIHWIDTAMCRPQQGAFIPYCPSAEISTNFVLESVGYRFGSDAEKINELNNRITTDNRLKEIFGRIKYFSNDTETETVSADDVEVGDDIDSTNEIVPTHYKHEARWKIVNTLVRLFGDKDGFVYARQICKGTPSDELRGYVNTAKTHNKEISEWAVNELRKKHGFNIRMKGKGAEVIQETNSINNTKIGDILSPVEQISPIENVSTLYLKDGQYLSDIQDDIISEMGDITILDAGAGFGKTEMVKRMGGRKLLVLPYTSIIESKIKADKTIKNKWLSFYGKERVTLKDLYCSDKSCVMTLDKFSNLNIDDLKTAGFDTVWVDESHLIFVSSFRHVMAPVLERLAQMPARGIKVVMMTGTPTAENLFFQGQKYIKVVREKDERQKDIKVIFSYKKEENDYHLCKAIAESIVNGRHILYPTNQGSRRFKQIVAKVQSMLNDMHFGREINTFYYKKSNAGTADMKKINEEKSIGDNDIIGCTNFLSVGVDICDKFDFDVFFDELFMPQDVEQFANRIRNNDLHIRIFLKEYDSEGDAIDYQSEKNINLSVSEDNIVEMHNLLRVCNDMIDRRGSDLKFNPLVSSICKDNKYIVFDEDVPEYRVDWTTFKLHLFEDRYKEYVTQFPCFVKSMKYYGYDIETIQDTEIFTNDKREEFRDSMLETKRIHVSEFTTEVFNLLDSLDSNNIELYNGGLKDSNFDLFRSETREEDRINGNIKVTDVEVLLKVMPYVSKLYTWFECPVIKDIFDDYTEKKSNRINMKKIQKACDFVTLETRRMKHQLDTPNYAFIKASVDFANSNPSISKLKIDEFINTWCCSQMNRIEDIVTFNPNVPNISCGSKTFLEDMKKYFTKLWNTVIETTSTSRKTGISNIRPFALNYDLRESFQDMYGDINLKLILGDEFTHHIRGINAENESDDTDINSLSTITTKLLDDWNSETKEGTHLSELPSGFKMPSSNSYYEFSEEDGSREKFVQKQARQHSENAAMCSEADMRAENDNNIINNVQNSERTLFDDIETISSEQRSHQTSSEADRRASEDNNIKQKTKKFTYNNEEDLKLGIDWDKIDALGLLGDDGMGV